jgi:DNA (cytosine-5)-methyltransferase 1
MRRGIPVVDLFAGPGGLGEGFESFRDPARPGNSIFRIAVSIEKDPQAHATLLLRSFFRQFHRSEVPQEYYRYLSREPGMTKSNLLRLFPRQFRAAQEQAWNTTLGKEPHVFVIKRIRRMLGRRKKWVLLGGPPCQAYSLAGRSRMRCLPGFEKDERHTFYREYLRIIADLEPPVFLMENVGGILSSVHQGERIFPRIVRDMKHPGKAINGVGNGTAYRIFPLGGEYARNILTGEPDPDPVNFLVRAEEHGIPQNRHRVFLLGIRSDIHAEPGILPQSKPPCVQDAIGDMPEIRSGLSKEGDSPDRWRSAVRKIRDYAWYRKGNKGPYREVVREIEATLNRMQRQDLGLGEEYFPGAGKMPAVYTDWYFDPRLKGFCNHSARHHMRSDLHRYLFASCFAAVNVRSPRLRHFPPELLPAHENRDAAMGGDNFADRFRVQIGVRPASTITSHISKDGHYFIHHDPAQCRSLTVREAARIQTFPDNYCFEGTRTSQYHQVGNAVPPLLARGIAGLIQGIFQRGMR